MNDCINIDWWNATGYCEEISKNAWFGFIGCAQIHWLHSYGINTTRKHKKIIRYFDSSIYKTLCNTCFKFTMFLSHAQYNLAIKWFNFCVYIYLKRKMNISKVYYMRLISYQTTPKKSRKGSFIDGLYSVGRRIANVTINSTKKRTPSK